jgi:hypothetical protein
MDPDAGEWTSLEAWKALPSNPDLNHQFGYELTDWDVITHDGDTGDLIFLPADQEALAEDAFIVAKEGDVCELVARR